MAISPPRMLAPLEWESEHFEIRAARVVEADLSDAALAMALALGREERQQLIVWSAPSGRDVPPGLLAEYGGRLADRKITFARTLSTDDEGHAGGESPCFVRPHTESSASEELIELAVAAGAYSRFRTDRGFAREKFFAMYRLWIERSLRGEMADAVLVADLSNGTLSAPLAGLISLEETAGTGSIGLIAVAQEARGRGVGTALLAAAHRWMLARGAQQARVVTQADNLPACRLYERAGYRLADVRHVFHFWL